MPKQQTGSGKPTPRKPKTAKTARTIAEVAGHFGVAVRTVGNWRVTGMPGRPGRFNLAAIAAWREGQSLGCDRQGDGKPGDRLKEAEAQLKELKLAKLRGELVAADAVCRLFRRQIAEAKTHLDQLPEEITGEFGDLVPDKLLARVRERIRVRVDSACSALADLLKGAEIASAEGNED